jgi:hypothetical protein
VVKMSVHGAEAGCCQGHLHLLAQGESNLGACFLRSNRIDCQNRS